MRKVVFTGSTEVGTDVAAGCARALKPVTLELGGKSANIVFADADLETAAATAPGAVFDNAGQDCCARSRILVQRSVYDRFLELLEPAVAAWRVGDPTLETTEMGPLISAAHRDTVDVVPRRRARRLPRIGARTATGSGSRRPSCSPTRRRTGSRSEEVFGPVVAVLPFEDEADAIRLANDTDLRPRRIDLDREPRPRDPRLARGQERRAVGQLALVGAVLDAVRRHEGLGPRP